MSAAAFAPRLDPLAGVAGALRTFRTRLAATGRALKGAAGSARRAGSAVDRIRSGAGSAGTALRQVKTRAEAAGRSLTRTGRTAGTTATRLKGTGGRARGATRPLNSLASGSGLFSSMAGLLGKASGTVSTLMGLLGGGLTVAAGAMTAVNVAMRANPLGFVLGLIVPVVAAIITFVMNSETGQKVMKQVFDQVLKVFRAIGKFLTPVIKAYAKVISTYFTAVKTIVTGVLKVVGAVLSKGFAGARSAISAATRAVTGLVRAAWGGFKQVLQPVLDWITKKIPDMFTRVKDAMSRTLRGIGDFVTTGMQNLLSVIKGPLNGLIAFANWVIDGLNSISVNIFGKKFGVDLPKIPQLAEGGIVEPPSGGGPGSVRPLASLDRLRPGEAGHRTQAASRPAGRVRLHAYHAAEGRGPLAVAADLLFLHRTAAA
ncbi:MULTISPECIES: tape-measure protein [unclassified Streptomyces]|uniref:tape-measure protein n=1 Tax=unclassified Streptomyces TaxID=2593676 RepID=UPI0013144B9B|nr:MULTISPECIES: tape-measure protein [unclassified Streptomyces]